MKTINVNGKTEKISDEEFLSKFSVPPLEDDALAIEERLDKLLVKLESATTISQIREAATAARVLVEHKPKEK